MLWCKWVWLRLVPGSPLHRSQDCFKSVMLFEMQNESANLSLCNEYLLLGTFTTSLKDHKASLRLGSGNLSLYINGRLDNRKNKEIRDPNDQSDLEFWSQHCHPRVACFPDGADVICFFLNISIRKLQTRYRPNSFFFVI